MQNRISTATKQQIIDMFTQGMSRMDISNQLGLEWKQVDYWCRKQARVSELATEVDFSPKLLQAVGEYYAYLLGAYLGDGYINKERYTWKIRFSCDVRYPGVINALTRALVQLGFVNAACCKTGSDNCVEVYAYGKHIAAMFPQVGPGRKHTRRINLDHWQQQIVTKYPQYFVRGLYHTDGCRYIHTDKKGDKVYQSVKYAFVNRSKDIIDLFCGSCDQLGIGYRVTTKKFIALTTNEVAIGWVIQLGRKNEVLKLEKFLGPK